MILISSAAYVEQDLAYEVGRLPPSFLPIGNKRLYEHQVEFLGQLNKQIYLSVPESFSISGFDDMRLMALGVELIIVPDGLTLGNSVMYCWNATGLVHSSLVILHGDTLFMDGCIVENDFVSVHPNTGAYSRAKISFSVGRQHHYTSDFVEDEQLVLSGLFSFTKPQLLMQGIVQGKGDFIAGVEHYAKYQTLTEQGPGLWLDFGHLNSFFRSRSLMTTQRSFNDLKIEPRVVIKSSIDKKKMLAESNWFKSLPRELQLHTPALLFDYHEISDKASYTLEYLYLLPLNDLLVFGRLSNAHWHFVFKSALSINLQFKKFIPQDFDLDVVDSIYLKKTLQRLDVLAKSDFQLILSKHEFMDINSLSTLAKDSARFINPVVLSDLAIAHGDFCFSNILFDSRTQALKLIDPRGVDSNGNITLYGDSRYDIAKFYHSVVGCYDFIIAGRYEICGSEINFSDNEKLIQLESLFENVFFNTGIYQKNEILAINVHLFISMLPLHSDRPDRQEAMLLNALRLYKKLIEIIK